MGIVDDMKRDAARRDGLSAPARMVEDLLFAVNCARQDGVPEEKIASYLEDLAKDVREIGP